MADTRAQQAGGQLSEMGNMETGVVMAEDLRRGNVKTGVLARAGAVLAIVVAGGVGVKGLQGCAYTVPPPEVVEQSYTGPNVEIEHAGSFHVLKFTAPTAGWSMRVDRVVEGYGFQGVYATVSKPNPAFSYAQQVVDQWVATSVRMSEPVKVFVRTVDFKGESVTGEAYSYVRESVGVIKPVEERRRAVEPAKEPVKEPAKEPATEPALVPEKESAPGSGKPPSSEK